MSKRTSLNLTLDEIIRRKQFPGIRNGRNAGKIVKRPGNFVKQGRALSSRLSWNGEGGQNVGLKRTFSNNYQRNAEAQGASKLPVHSRLSIANRLKTKNSVEAQPVRMTNGAVVKGLRSDQLLLQKFNQRRNSAAQSKVEQIRERYNRTVPEAARPQRPFKRFSFEDASIRRDGRLGDTPRERVSFDHGLTVSFANEMYRLRRPAEPRRRRPSTSSESYSSESPSPPPSPPPLLQVRKRSRSSREVSSVVTSAPAPAKLVAERPPPPKPHRQLLDPQIKKEIATLQGLADSQDTVPGPGIKGFKMIPNLTKSSLNDRFSQEKKQEPSFKII